MNEIVNSQELFESGEEIELISMLNSGNVILFLGAGFSKGIKNTEGNEIPLAGDLSKQMNQILISYGEKGFSKNNETNLKFVSDSFFNLFKESPKAIDNFFKAHLTVDRNQIPENYYNLKKVNWNGIYTTNYDDLLEAIYESNKGGNISFKKSVYKKDNSSLPLDNKFNIVYLHGDFSCNARFESNNNVIITDLICSITDYSTNNIPIPQIWTSFIEKFRQYSIILVGSQLNEEAFYNSLGSLINTTNFKGNSRPKSYIINLDEDDQKFEELKKNYNLHHKVAKSHVFLDWLASKSELINSNLNHLADNIQPANRKSNNFIEFTKEYWEQLKNKKSTDDLLKYYTNINSSLSLLPYVVADNYYVEPDEESIIRSKFGQKDLKDIFPSSPLHSNLIRINANGGTGKSTFLQHIGKKYCEQYHILYFKKLFDETSNLPIFPNDNIPVIILLDNYGKQIDKLKAFSQALHEAYLERGFCLIATERHLEESILDSKIKHEIEELFTEFNNYKINYDTTSYIKIFEKLISLIDTDNKLLHHEKTKLKEKFSTQSKATTAERIIDFLISINQLGHGFNFHFDWEDWEKLCKTVQRLNEYSNLYSIVAIFNNYDITPPIKFCIDLLGINDINLINTYSIFSEPKFDFPITIQKDKFFELRNTNLANWFIKEKDSSGTLTKKYFQEAISSPISHEQIYLLRNSYRNPNFKRNETLKQLIPERHLLLSIFEQYINDNPFDTDNSKNRMEMVIINLEENRNDKAKTLLQDIIDSNAKDVHARSKLADILIREKKYDEANEIIDEIKEIDPTNIYILELRIVILKYSTNRNDLIEKLFNDIALNKVSIVHIILLCKLSVWLKDHNRFDDSETIISKAKKLNEDAENFYINTIYATVLLEKIQRLTNPDSVDGLTLLGQCEKICLETLNLNPNHERTLHILYRLNLFFRGKMKNSGKEKILNGRRFSYSKKYKKYLAQLFLINRSSVFVFEGIIQHLRTTRRYRLAIAFIGKYESEIKSINPFLYNNQLYIFLSFLGNKKQIEPSIEIAREKNFKLPNVNFPDNIELISQDNIGHLIDNKIYSKDLIYDIKYRPNINNRVKKTNESVKVFFGLYKINGKVLADFIEPFFEAIPDDYTALKLFELD